MTTLRTIIKHSLRESGILPGGADPTLVMLDEGLFRLKRLISHEISDESLPRVTYGSKGLSRYEAQEENMESRINSRFAPSNIRLLCNLNADSTVYLNPKPGPGDRFAVLDNLGEFSTNSLTLNGNGCLIEGAESVTLSTDSLNRSWFFRDDLNSWERVTELTVDDDLPFPQEFELFFIIGLAISMNPRYSAQTQPETLSDYRQARSRFRARYQTQKKVPLELTLAFTRPVRHNNSGVFGSEGFTYGRI